MKGYFAVSDASSIALHATVMIARNSDRPIKIREIAQTFSISEAHLAKVLGKLLRAGIVAATRGPTGGYRLARPPEDITLYDIHSAIEGVYRGGSRCMFRMPLCDGTGCPLGLMFSRMSEEIETALKKTKKAIL